MDSLGAGGEPLDWDGWADADVTGLGGGEVVASDETVLDGGEVDATGETMLDGAELDADFVLSAHVPSSRSTRSLFSSTGLTVQER